MTTRQISNAVHYLFRDATHTPDIRSYVAQMITGDMEEHDVDAIEAELRSEIDKILPAGASLNGEFIFVESGVEMDQEAIRDEVASINVWDIVERNSTELS